jgi:hypothetical protein
VSGFRHLILTRFNVRHAPWQRDKSGADVLTDAWMEHRFGLFDRFCFPSVRAQTATGFEWLVFFDPDTPEPFRARIDRYRDFEPFRPVFARDDELIDRVREAAGNADSLITTRLDNDDAIHRDMVANVQKELPVDRVTFVNWLHGYFHAHAELIEVEHPSNMFISMIEPRSDQPFRSVWCAEHKNLSRHGEIRQITGTPGWITLVHERNLMNEVRAPDGLGVRRRTRLALERIGLLAPPPATAEAPQMRPSRQQFREIAADFGLDPAAEQ